MVAGLHDKLEQDIPIFKESHLSPLVVSAVGTVSLGDDFWGGADRVIPGSSDVSWSSISVNNGTNPLSNAVHQLPRLHSYLAFCVTHLAHRQL